MATQVQARMRGAAVAPGAGTALRLLAIGIGIFFIGMCSSKVAWFTNRDILLQKFQTIFLPKAPPIVQPVVQKS